MDKEENMKEEEGKNGERTACSFEHVDSDFPAVS